MARATVHALCGAAAEPYSGQGGRGAAGHVSPASHLVCLHRYPHPVTSINVFLKELIPDHSTGECVVGRYQSRTTKRTNRDKLCNLSRSRPATGSHRRSSVQFSISPQPEYCKIWRSGQLVLLYISICAATLYISDVIDIVNDLYRYVAGN